MVYINTRDESEAVYFPMNGRGAFQLETAGLSVKNTVDGRVLTLPIASVDCRGILSLIVVAIPEELTAGEWEYRLTAGEDLVASGLLVAYDGPRPEPTQYESENNVIQYGG